MRIEIDTDRCQGHGRCYAEAPDLVDYDDFGRGVIRGDGHVFDGQSTAARTAARTCPEAAVLIVA